MTWALGYAMALVALVVGMTLGRGWGRRGAFLEAASAIDDEALRAILHARLVEPGALFDLARQVREFESTPTIFAGDNGRTKESSP